MLYTVARLHYVADLSQVKIARQLGLSTATISRILARARAEGIVRIEVRDPVEPDALGERLAQRLGLKSVSVSDLPASSLPAALATPLGQILLTAAPQPGAVIAIGWGRAIRAVLETGLPTLSAVHVVPATGGLQQQAEHFQINEFIRHAAAQLGGKPHFIHAPYLPSAETRASFLSDPAIQKPVALWDRIDIAIMGVGLPPALNPPEASVATACERSLPEVAGDVIRHYYDAQGNLIDWEGAARLIAASPDQLRAARLCIGVAAGPAKAQAIVGAARARLISALVTDVATAEAILASLAVSD
ncbi:MAG: winged helix-turn-helix transcriptional regulator [Rhodobacterales bacterium]|nr:winged helix-turn-helix transcriptional regulator [Rhodobacterales bacterium]